ncbi:DUF6233 domain-containing protein [Streptomyces sp. NPDC005576]|uniref:DUF6233 domain-containing protein n=1 Tax=Streptomyces sp. NPDC005576 TaxID=3364726 RepID=UPI003685ADF2
MYDLPPDLPRLHTLRTWIALQLDHIDKAIAAAERETAPARQPAVERTVEPPPTPDWGITRQGRGAPVTEIHRGDCWAYAGRMEPISREQAIAELRAGVQPCDVCRPEQELHQAP